MVNLLFFYHLGYDLINHLIDCNVPLMRNKQKDIELCVGCNRNYLKEALDQKLQ